MNGDRTLLLGLVALVVAGAALAAPGAAGPSADGTLSLSSAEAATDSTVTVELSADADDVAGYQARIEFDPDVVRVAEVEGLDYADPVTNVDNDEGWVHLTQSRAEGTDDPGLAAITFEVVGEPGAATTLSFDESETLVNGERTPELAVETEPGEISVDAAAGTPADDLSADEGSTPAQDDQQPDETPDDRDPVQPDDDGTDGFGPIELLAGALGLAAAVAVGVAVGRRI
jgi:hypothetical protein